VPDEDLEGLAMSLTHHQIDQYHRDGFILLEGRFAARELAVIRAAMPAVLGQRNERTILEDSGRAVRSVYGIHRHDAPFTLLGRHPRLVAAARSLLAGDVYIYQSKLNVKSPFHGEMWDWHQDYTFWREQDRMPAPRVLTAAVFLDDVRDTNGPLMVIPGSHHEGVLACFAPEIDAAAGAPSWQAHVSSRLEYTIDRAVLGRLAETRGLQAIKGRAGSVLLFDGRIAHASPPNLSPFPRELALFTYNHVDNSPPAHALRRPEFLVSRDSGAIDTVNDEALIRLAETAGRDGETR
jgi:ectoine hydroxylase